MAKKVKGTPLEITGEKLMKAKTVGEFVELYMACTLPRSTRQRVSRRWAKAHGISGYTLKLEMNKHPKRKNYQAQLRNIRIQTAGNRSKNRPRWDNDKREDFIVMHNHLRSTGKRMYSDVALAKKLGVSYYSIIYNTRKYYLSLRVCKQLKVKPTMNKLVNLMSFSAVYLVKCYEYAQTHTANIVDILDKNMPFVQRKGYRFK